VKSHTSYLALFSLAMLGAAVEPCFATTIHLDFSGLTWSGVTQDQYYDLQFNSPNAGVSYTLSPISGITTLRPSAVAASYAAAERGLTINLNGSQSYEQLEIQVDFRFFNGVAYGLITTLGMYAVPQVFSPATPAVQMYYPDMSMPGDPLMGAVVLQVDHFQFDFLHPPAPPPVIVNIQPVIGPGGTPNPGFDPPPIPGIDPIIGLETPEPASIMTLGLGLALLGALRRRQSV